MKSIKKHQRSRLLKICQIIRECLGLGSLGIEYEFKRADGKSYASSYMFYSGWRLRITIYNNFFAESFTHQLETLVHEHLHGAMMPFEQAVMRTQQHLPKSKQDSCDEAIHVGREITVEHLAAPLAKMILPKIPPRLRGG